jgi:hypothetical protein
VESLRTIFTRINKFKCLLPTNSNASWQEAFEYVDAGEYCSDNVALANVCVGFSVEAAHAAEVPARGVDPLLSCDEGTVDYAFEMGVEVAWDQECCILSRGDVRPLMFAQADSFMPRFPRGGESLLGCAEDLREVADCELVKWDSGILY